MLKKNSIEIKIPENIGTAQTTQSTPYMDTRTKVPTFVLPITLSNGDRTLWIISRLKKGSWNPNKDIESIIINLKENED